jgi:hypothetical protein
MKTTLRRVLTTTVIAFGATVAASADTIIAHTGNLGAVSTASGGPTSFNYGNVPSQPTVPLTLAQFNDCATINGRSDPGGGTDSGCVLTSIHFTINGSIATTYSVQNTSGSDASYTVTSAATLGLINSGSPAFTYVEALPTMTTSTGTIASGATKTGAQNASATGTANYICTTTSCTLDSVTPSGTPVSSPISATPFIGSGTLTLFAAGNFTGSIGGTGFIGSIGGTGSETVTVQYDYSYNEVIPSVTTTPEPISMALVGGGLIALGLLRKRQKS